MAIDVREEGGKAVDPHDLLIRLAYRFVAHRQEKADLLDHFGAEPFAAALQRTLAAPLPESVSGLVDLEARLQDALPVHSEPNPLWVAWMKTVHRQKLDQLREGLDALLRKRVTSGSASWTWFESLDLRGLAKPKAPASWTWFESLDLREPAKPKAPAKKKAGKKK